MSSYLNAFLGLLAKTSSRDTVPHPSFRFSDLFNTSPSTLKTNLKKEPLTMSMFKCAELVKSYAFCGPYSIQLKSERNSLSYSKKGDLLQASS